MLRLYAILSLLLLSSVPSFAARQRAFGWCEQGGQRIMAPGNVIQSQTAVQQSYPSCTITVYQTGTTTKATLYADNSNTALSNPFTATTRGFYVFYADDGVYDIQLSGGGFTSPYTIGAVQVGPYVDSSGVTHGSIQITLNGAVAGNSIKRDPNERASDQVSVKDFYGADGIQCQGNNVHDDTSCIQNAINYTLPLGKSLFFPSGKYITTAMLTAYQNSFGPIMQGEAGTYIVYKGVTTIPAVLQISSLGSIGANYINSVYLDKINFIGNQYVANTLAMYKIVNSNITNIGMWGADPTAGSCLYSKNGVGVVYNGMTCIQGVAPVGTTGTPFNGLTFDGDSGAIRSTTSDVINPRVALIGNGVALNLLSVENFNIYDPQISTVGTCVSMPGGLMVHFLGGLCEDAHNSDGIVLSGSDIDFKGWVHTNSNMHVTGNARNVSIDGILEQNGTLTIDATSRSTRVTNFAGNNSIVDNAPDTYINGVYSSSLTDRVMNTPQQKSCHPVSSGSVGSTVDLGCWATGTWFNASSAVVTPIFATPFTPGKAWKAVLQGRVFFFGGSTGQFSYPYAEITDVSPTVAVQGAGVLTFSVDATTGYFQMIGNANFYGFTGTIHFMPDSKTAAGSGNKLSIAVPGIINYGLTQPNNRTAAVTCNTGTGAGTGATCAVTGANNVGKITFTTGTSPSTNNAVMSITWPQSWPSIFYGCLVTPANLAAATPPGNSVFFNQSLATLTTGYIYSGSSALSASTAYVYNYICQ